MLHTYMQFKVTNIKLLAQRANTEDLMQHGEAKPMGKSYGKLLRTL